MGRAVTARTAIRSDVQTVRRLAQTPSEHVRWDIRFTEIDYLPKHGADSPQRFRYATRLGFGKTIEGWGETIERPDSQGSALRFGSDDPKSLIAQGTGSWIYRPRDDTVDFRTTYNYEVRHGILGRTLDFILFRPLMTWAVRWSFDRLRIWIEQGLAPEWSLRLWATKRAAQVLLGLVWILNGLVPKILEVRPTEIELVRDSQLFVGSPEATLAGLGAAEVAAGLWLLSGRAERAAVVTTTAAMVFLATIVAWIDPASLTDPYGGLSKNLGLLGCAIAVYVLSPMTPKARRSRPGRNEA